MSSDAEKPVPAMEDFAAIWRKEFGLPERNPNARPETEAEREDRTRGLIRDQRMTIFRELCPAHFLVAIDRTKIPRVASWDAADTWSGEYPGLWLWSHETGHAKTRMLWRKFGELYVKHGRPVVRTTGVHLAEEYMDAHRSGRTREFYRRFVGLVVMLDDLDKIELPEPGQGFGEQDRSARNARMLRELFDGFYERHAPVLVTANEDIAWFAQRIGASAERRMRDVCREIEF